MGATFVEYASVFFETTVFLYGTVLLLIYAMLAVMSFINIRLFLRKESYTDYKVIVGSPLAPGISVIAPAFNEGLTIISNIRSLLTFDYPNYEVIIINDGSTDDTLEKVVNEFSLVKVDFAYDIKLSAKPVRGVYKSTDEAYAKLVIVDKENGKSKADATNVGINVAAYPYFLCTDVDCILHDQTLQMLIRPMMEEENKRVIATGATLRMANSCEVDEGVLIKIVAPKPLLARFQELEYIRSFVLGKMGWSYINAVPNVSGGLGMFDKEIAVKAGGYDPASFGEDMELRMRMSRYVYDNKIDAAVRYIPTTLCWTEGPTSLKIFMRQRTRWARGLLQLMQAHKKMLFNPAYGRVGLIVFPYNFFFELLAPVIEFLGIIYYIFLIYFGLVNWPYAIILLIFVYTYSVMISSLSVLWDQLTFQYYKTWRDVVGIISMVFIEMLIYHPLIVVFALRGYYFHLSNRTHTWGNMQRRGFKKATDNTPKAATT
ncbi:MAG: glycosyltransferase family 2 protein [Taibaiella sp.]|nr:glycosyltransferase family 2 protein [Taibaiella sp.]